MEASEKMERPDQARFDHFSRHFERIDDRLERFGREFGWKLIKNPLRQPERDLQRVRIAKFMFGIYVEGNWLTLDENAPLLHTMGLMAIYQPVSDLHFINVQTFAEHQTFEYVEAHLEEFLQRAQEFYEKCPLPALTTVADGGCYSVPKGWYVSSPQTLKALD